jgi:hypothetical protein
MARCSCCWLLLLLQATAADDGQCLVYDTDCFGGGSNAESLVTHVASWRVTPETVTSTEITALAWHTAGALIVGTSAGVCLDRIGCDSIGGEGSVCKVTRSAP